jgi:inward rectifier potassium channel
MTDSLKQRLLGRRTQRVPPGKAADRGGASRIVARDGSESVRRLGLSKPWHGDLYHRMLTLGWFGFMGLAAVIYVAANLIFAWLYWLEPDSVSNAKPGSFLDLFFFSVETFATVGYGVMAPQTLYSNVIMTIETLVGIMTVALTTGLLFARVSRPTAQVMFAKVAVIDTYNGAPALMVRMGNQRRSQIIEASVGLTLLRSETTSEGRYMRRFHDLALLRPRTPVFALSFTAIHLIDAESPLFGVTAEALASSESELLVTVTGLEETMGQTVHARASYLPDDIRMGVRYVDIFGRDEHGRRSIDYSRFHVVESTH